MKIELIEVTGQESIKQAAIMPYQTKPKDLDKLVYNIWKLGHRSITRHSNVAFLVKDVSQSLLRQLSRHPHINLTVKSSRYCNMEDSKSYMPKWVDRDFALGCEYSEDYKTIMEIYKKWAIIEEEYDKKDTAKQFLPLCSTTDLIVSGNIQAIYEFLQLRNCVRSEEEIFNMSREMTKQLAKQDGFVGQIFGKLGCKGDELGYCPEGAKMGCGKYSC